MNLEIKKNLRRAAKFYTYRWRYDRRIRWFAKVDGRWLPMTPFYKSVAGLEHCNTYRAQGALEALGVRVHRFGPAASRRLQRRLRLAMA